MSTNSYYFTVLLITFSGIGYGQTNNDLEQTIAGYYDSFYTGDTLRFKEVFSKDVVKFGYWKKDGKYHGEPMSYEKMDKYVKRVNKQGSNHDTSIKEIVVYDEQEQLASARIKAWWGYDYLLLAKEEGKWVIRMVLWQGPLSDD